MKRVEWWNTGMVEEWNDGILEQWKNEKSEYGLPQFNRPAVSVP